MRTLRQLKIAIVLLFVAALLYLYLCTPSANRGDSKSLSRITMEKMTEIQAALELFRADLGRYPTTQEGLKYLIQNHDGNWHWVGPYLNVKEIPSDAWGHSFLYLCPGRHGRYDLVSYGRDGSEGGTGQDEDIIVS